VELLNGTIAMNIGYGDPAITQTGIEDAARAADAHDFINALPLGYETQVGDAGQSLSGGQRQRIGIARALANRPSLLILDEATNAVDKASEEAIMRIVEAASKTMTVLVISHHKAVSDRCSHHIFLGDDAGGGAAPASDIGTRS
jgi:ABC-type bacteriocin/lantibiotic exporter with double-glycine peptidase domain